MREPSCFALAAASLTGFVMVAAIVLIPGLAKAQDRSQPVAKAAPPRLALDEIDRIAALESIQFALSEVGDGASYVWHRTHGRLSGVVQPVSSFKGLDGMICRHVKVALSSGPKSSQTEGVACRLPNGQWRLEG